MDDTFIVFFLFCFFLFVKRRTVWEMVNDAVTFSEIDSGDIITVAAPKYEEKYLDKLNIMPITELDDRLLDNLVNSHVVEYTPLGNVMMCYNHKRKTFDYYSDAIIPYRYLEPVCRKYVIMFHCRALYVEMQVKETVIKEPKKLDKPKVFAKLKTYKTSVEKAVMLKDDINHYSYQGKMNNFDVMKRVDKTVTNKRLKMTFAEFKKIKAC
jgi:hypothetical protein